jgi:hypothetical protein
MLLHQAENILGPAYAIKTSCNMHNFLAVGGLSLLHLARISHGMPNCAARGAFYLFYALYRAEQAWRYAPHKAVLVLPSDVCCC